MAKDLVAIAEGYLSVLNFFLLPVSFTMTTLLHYDAEHTRS